MGGFLAISLLVNLLLLLAFVDAKQAIDILVGKIENLENRLSVETERRRRAEKIQEIPPQTVTAADIVKNQAKRFKLRRSWSEQERILEERNNQKEKKHLDLVAEFENIQHLGGNPGKE